MIESRPRPFPERGTSLEHSIGEFLEFVQTTSVNKLAGLTEAQAGATPLPTSPVMSPLGLVKHLTAVLRQHIQIHIGGHELPSLWRADDHDHEFRLTSSDSIESVVAAFDRECELSRATLSGVTMDAEITTYGEPNRVGRVLVDVLQESARHLGHMDILREMIDGSTGE
ncbi:MAG: DUF664 domain-containing protein [bacterium]|nr:DUF664 domain-containing protein [bacterium]